MATVSTVTVIDDIDGSEAHETVVFSLHGSRYTIDLSDANAAELRRALQAFVTAGRKLGSDKSTPPTRGRGVRHPAGERRTRTPAARDESAAIRVWAKEAGLAVSDRGRISTEVLERYHESRAGGPPADPVVADDSVQPTDDEPQPGGTSP